MGPRGAHQPMPRTIDLEALQRELSGGRPQARVSVDDLSTYLRSPFNLWADLHAPATEQQAASGYDALVRDVSFSHRERMVIIHFADLPLPPSRDHRVSFATLLRGMAEGARGFRRHPLLWDAGGLWGEPAVLVRTESAPSRFGPWSYEVVHLTLARTLRDHHHIPAMAYNLLLSKVQGRLPTQVTIIDGAGAFHRIPHDPLVLDETVRAVMRIVEGEPVRPFFGGADAPWSDYCDQLAVAARDVSLVSKVGPAAARNLATLGIYTVEHLAGADREALQSLPRVGAKTADGWIAAAQVLSEGTTPRRLEAVSLPRGRPLAFLDFESTIPMGSDPDEGGVPNVDYLIGVLQFPDGAEIGPRGGTYLPFVAHRIEAEEEAFGQFLAWFEDNGRPPLLHWSSYEKTRFNRLFDAYPTHHRLRAPVLEALVDLLDRARRGWIFPTTGYGLKVVAHFLGYRWRHADVTALQSIVHYLNYVQNPQQYAELLRKVLDYNEDDLRATALVYQWLATHEAPAGRATLK